MKYIIAFCLTVLSLQAYANNMVKDDASAFKIGQQKPMTKEQLQREKQWRERIKQESKASTEQCPKNKICTIGKGYKSTRQR